MCEAPQAQISTLDKLVKAHLLLPNDCINLQTNKPRALCGNRGEKISESGARLLPSPDADLIDVERAGDLLLVVTHTNVQVLNV